MDKIVKKASPQQSRAFGPDFANHAEAMNQYMEGEDYYNNNDGRNLKSYVYHLKMRYHHKTQQQNVPEQETKIEDITPQWA